ncbi:hypothetical protein EDB84DRAFT_112461 [Lactarius hengduanensis]|nr:hypothetical protein EDB84DRAFT_112461 [Lactarius hengduanensis]
MILAGRSELKKFGTLIEEYVKLCQNLAEDPRNKTTAKNWNFPKMHALVHSFDDIEAKGASRNYNTKPNEKMHSFLRMLYLNRTNFKNVASQILKHEHVALVGELIRGQINELDAAIRATYWFLPRTPSTRWLIMSREKVDVQCRGCYFAIATGSCHI